MQIGSLVGFCVVFVVLAPALSVALTLLLWLRRSWLRGLGPAAERRAVELVAAVPVLLSAALVAVLVVRSQVGVDHCELHDHHAHLCVLHGAPWVEQTWAVALVALVGAIAVVRIAIFTATTVRQRRSVMRLRRACSRRDGIRWIDTPDPLCFVAGVRAPEIFVSDGAWSALDDDERAAMLAHERAHVRQRDVARRMILELLLRCGAPLARMLRGTWDRATERLCDARAVEATGCGAIVASAMVKVCRLGLDRSPTSASFSPEVSALRERVEAALAEQPPGDRAANRLAAVVALVVASIMVASVLRADALHHALESMLG